MYKSLCFPFWILTLLIVKKIIIFRWFRKENVWKGKFLFHQALLIGSLISFCAARRESNSPKAVYQSGAQFLPACLKGPN